jgi:hypothetical protein
MANFRCERLFVMLDDPIPGFDHLRAVEPFEFAESVSDSEALTLGVTPLNDFAYAPFQRPRWRPAAEGLESVRALIGLYEKWLARGKCDFGYRMDFVEQKLRVMRQVESVLDAADTHDRQFHFAMRDLE